MKNHCFALCIALTMNANSAFGANEGMPQLNPEFWMAQVFWLIFIFSGLYIVIWKIFLPRIADIVENRKSRVVNDLNEAQKLKEKAEKKLHEYENLIEKTKKEAKKIIQDNQKKLDNDIENKKKKFNEEIEQEILKMEKEIRNLKKTSISNINKIAVEVSSEVIKQIIGIDANISKVSAIVEDISKKKIEKHL